MDEDFLDFVNVPASEKHSEVTKKELTEDELKSEPVCIDIMFYYTSEYEAMIYPSLPEDYVNLMVANINENFVFTFLDISVRAFCVKRSTVDEASGSPNSILTAFRMSMLKHITFLTCPSSRRHPHPLLCRLQRPKTFSNVQKFLVSKAM